MAAPGKINILQLLVQHIKEEWVMWPLVFLSMAMVAIVIERLLVIILDRVKLSPVKFIDKFYETLKKHDGDKLQAIEEMEASMKKKDNICAEMLRTIFRKYKDGSSKKMNSLELKQWMTEAVEEKASIELPALEAHLGWLAVISNVATLMGLFGTVYGMIEAFYSMSQSVGGVKADEMAGGIAVALIATLFGLLVAIPSLLLYNFIKNSTEAHIVRLEEAMNTVIETLLD
jgi:biopolymer transport protein ExbB